MEKPEINFNAADAAFALAMLVCGFLYWNLIRLYALGAGVTIFTIVLCAASCVYLFKSGVKQKKRSLICLFVVALSAAQFSLFDNQFIAFLNFIFLTLAFIYWICLSTNRNIDKKLSAYIIGDAFTQIIRIPFMNFGCFFGGMKKGFSKQKKGKGILAALIGILIFMPLLAAVMSLLISADVAFENFVGRLHDYVDFYKGIEYIMQFIIGVPVACYIYGLIYGDVKGRYTDRITSGSVDNAANAVKIAPKITIYTGLSAFNIIYMIFFMVQVPYLFSAFSGNLPETFTYAEYARRGFFELCAVAGINLCVLLISHLTIKKEQGNEPKVLRAQTSVISLFTILLIATALSKMAMYIDTYGLTQLRVFTSWFMTLMLLIFIIILARQLKVFNAAKPVIVSFVLMFMILLYGNPDGLIAKYNIERYEAGTLAQLDIEALTYLSDAAVPHMYGLYLRTDDSMLRQELKDSIIYYRIGMLEAEYDAAEFREFNIQRFRAHDIKTRLENGHV